MKKFFRKVWNFIKRNTYALAVCACVVLVLTLVSLTAVSVFRRNSDDPIIDNVVDEPIIDQEQQPSVPSGSDEVIVFAMPLENASIYKGYAEHDLLMDNTSGSFITHQGIDFKAEAGAKVLAVFDGEVVKVENSMMDGIVITIKHSNELVSVYRCLGNDPLVSAGDKVVKGQQIGTVSSNLTEKADGYHLHYELYENDKLIDPSPYFAEGDK